MKHFYYIDLGTRCYEVVFTETEIDRTKNYQVKAYTTRGTYWETPSDTLCKKRKSHMIFPNSEYETIEQYKRSEKLKEIGI